MSEENDIFLETLKSAIPQEIPTGLLAIVDQVGAEMVERAKLYGVDLHDENQLRAWCLGTILIRLAIVNDSDPVQVSNVAALYTMSRLRTTHPS